MIQVNMPNPRSIFNFSNPWLDFNLLYSAEFLRTACQIGLALGCMYQLAPWVSNPFAGPSTTHRSDKLVAVGLRTTYVALLGWSVLRSKFVIAPDLDGKETKPLKESSNVTSERPWINRYLEGAAIVTAYTSSFLAPITLQIPLRFCHELLAPFVSVTYLGIYYFDYFKPFIPWRHVTMAMTRPIYRHFIDPERQRIAHERVSLARGFLGVDGASRRFQYKPLASTKMIRLLKIKVEESTPTQATCDFIEVDIDNSPPYEAISYCWGPTPLDQPFRLYLSSSPGTHIPLTRNAHEALRALTPIDGLRLFFLDSVCINQDSTFEKTQQLQLIGKVYSNAQKVVVFLGSQSEDPRAVYFLNRTFYYYQVVLSSAGHEVLRVTRSAHSITDSVFAPGTQDIAAVQGLLNNNYFYRMWIIQECVLARNIDVLFGNIPFPWTVLYQSLLLLMNQENFLTTVFYGEMGGFLGAKRSLSGLPSLANLRLDYSSDEPTNSLVELVVWNRYAQATDPKDKVYALLGLCPEADVEAIRPKYEKSVETIYTDVVKRALQQRSFLSFCISGLTYNDVGCQPSNSPSWLLTFTQLSEFFTTIRYHTREYQAGSSLIPEFEFASPDHVLRLKGIFVDTIGDKSSDRDRLDTARKIFDDPVKDMVMDCALVVREMQDLIEPHKLADQLPLEDQKVAFWRTVLGDPHAADASGQPELPHGISQLEEVVATLRKGDIPRLIDDENLTGLSLRQIYKQGQILRDHVVNLASSVMLDGRAFAITKEKKLFASVPMGSEVGDIIVIFNGAPAPCILRSTGHEDNCYYLVGEVYVHGIMHGEAMKSEDCIWFNLR